VKATLASLALAVAACRGGDAPAAEPADERPPANVTCAPVVAGPRVDTLALRGAVAPPPRAQATIAATVPGRIARLGVDEGDHVAAGALVAAIEDPGLGAGADESGAELAAAEAELRGAGAERVRRERLVGQGVAPQRELDEARAREESARAVVAAAQARQRLARGKLSRAELRAPFAGTVLHVFRRAGAVVEGADTAVVEIADLSVLELRAQVTGAELIGLAVGDAATVVLDAVPGVEIPGEVVAVAAALDPTTSLGTVRVRLAPPPALHLAVGLPGVARVARAPRVALSIPAAAVRRSMAGSDEVVRCVGPAGKADKVEIREVALGVRSSDSVEVVSGLAAGDRVVVDHLLGLEDGAAIAERAP